MKGKVSSSLRSTPRNLESTLEKPENHAKYLTRPREMFSLHRGNRLQTLRGLWYLITR